MDIEQKKVLLDLLNWVKSELKEVEQDKLGKTMSPYRSEKLIFLRSAKDKIEKAYTNLIM